LFSNKTIGKKNIVLFDHDRNGIFIHRDCLSETAFSVGDRFSVHKGKRELFTLKIIRDEQGDFLLDKNGIFIHRSKRVDILLGGLYEEFVLEFSVDAPNAFLIRPR
jgi:hypothetical protein